MLAARTTLPVEACDLCGGKLLGIYFENPWGDRYCAHHAVTCRTCPYCHRLCRGNRQNCDRCTSHAITRSTQARPIFSSVVNWLGLHGLRFNDLDLKIELRTRSQLRRLAPNLGSDQCLGITLREERTFLGRTTSSVMGVAILRGLPTTLFQKVAVHELGHAWLGTHSITGLKLQEEEGFCELLAHRYLLDLGTTEGLFYARRIEQCRDVVYGNGFRTVLGLSDSVGFSNLVSHLKEKKRLPSAWRRSW